MSGPAYKLPPPLTAKERRQFAKAEADVRWSNERPNEDPHAEEARSRVDRCAQSKYQTHRFVVSGGRSVCEFCGRTERECRR